MNNVEKWAKDEISQELKNCKNDWYAKNVLKCAYKVYKKLCRQNHSGMSIQLVKSVLDRLIDLKPLSHIEDVPEEWNDVTWDDRATVYQNKRYSGLFKNVHKDGSIDYNDVERWVCYDDSGITFHSSAVSRILDKKYPISLPYYPVSNKVYVKEFLFDSNNGDFDTMYVRYEDGNYWSQWFLKETENGFVEITESEYLNRYRNKINVKDEK